jgi:hypothetical protein
MTRALIIAGIVLAYVSPPEAWAQDFNGIRATNALHDMARAQERQADSLRRMEMLQHDRARAADTARHNAERDSRSLRRFDHR